MRNLLLLSAVLVFVSAIAVADWDDGDPCKMHFPQLPDPYGWDIDIVANNVAADDWQCTQSGPVTDIHFWYSWEHDVVGLIGRIGVTIFSNVPADPDVPGSFSHPGEVLWYREFVPDQFTVRLWSDDPTDPQGFFDAGGGWLPNDHGQTWQCNITDIEDPFEQVEDSIYWLGLSVWLVDPLNTHLGWKTSQDHFMDDAVFMGPNGWVELYPYFNPQYESLDLAFVIAPEPGSLALLALGGLALLRRR